MELQRTAETATQRIADGLVEARAELSLSRSQLARLSGVSRSSISKLENGGRINPRLVVQLAIAVCVLDLFSLPRLEDELAGAVNVHTRKEEAHV